MRMLAPVSVALVVASAVFSTVMWRDLRSSRQALQAEQQALQDGQQSLLAERQLADTLRTQLEQARTELAARPAVQPATEAVPAPARNVQASPELVALVTDAAKRQKALLEGSESHKGRLAEVRVALKNRNPLLARELGISEQEADKIFDVIAESQLRQEGQAVDLIAGGHPNDAAAIAEMQRQLQAQEQEDKNTLVAMLGTAGYEKLQYVEETQAAHTRIVNLKTVLAQSGQPLTNDQMFSLTKVVADEQKLEEKESQQLRDSGQLTQASQVERAVQGDRRILDNASGFLSAQQLQTIRARFEQRQAMERATGNVTTRERPVGQVVTN